jgi:prolyl oligopeptidase
MMKTKLILLILICIFTNTVFAQNITLTEKSFTKNYFGKIVDDSYRYIENRNDTLVQKWFKQNSLQTRTTLDQISGRKKIVEKLLEFEKRKSFSVTLLNITDDNYSFYLKKLDKDKTGKLYYKTEDKVDEILLYDPSEYKKASGNKYIINYIKPSLDSKTVALGLSKNGEEIAEIVFFNVITKTILPEVITHCWPAELAGLNWLPDNSGIIYIHIPVIDTKDKNYILNTESVVYKLGDNPLNHKTIFSRQNNPEISIDVADFPVVYDFDPKDKYVTASLSGATTFENFYFTKKEELNSPKINWKSLFTKNDGIKTPTILNDDLYCLSSKNASNFKIIKTKIINPDFQNAEVIVANDKMETIDDYVITKDGLFYTTTKNGVEARLYFVDNNKIIKPINLPFQAGALSIVTKNKFSTELWVTIKGWLSSSRRYKYDVAKNEFIEADLVPIIKYPEFKDFLVEEIEIPSHDGVMVPVSLIYKKGLKKNKMNNVLIDAYGSYGVSMSPQFRPVYLSWVLNDGVYVVPHVRGGGEKGDDWHKGGYKSNKSNTWKDLIATAEYLIKEKITTNKRIAISSGSAGGILVGRAITERPDLFKVMLCENGYLNTLRINDAPNGPNNMKELGNPDIEEEFSLLYETDAYHHIKKGIQYPACLISTGMNDARVPPYMSGKFVAKLKASTTSNNPVLFAVDYNAGHGMDSSSLQLYNDYADGFAFAFWQMGHPKFKLINNN